MTLYRSGQINLSLVITSNLYPKANIEKRSDPNIMLDSISEDPFGLKSEDPEKIKETEKFLKITAKHRCEYGCGNIYGRSIKIFLKKMDKVSIRDTAFEIALLGAHGIHPEKNYKLNSISGKEFTGYKILSYYYVSWKLVIPEKLPELKLPYDNEYELAEKLFKNDA
jgi:hypothetical protein